MLRVVSWNLRYDEPSDAPYHWAGRWAWICEAFRDSSADVLGLQEVLPHQWADMRGLLPEHDSVGQGRDADGGGEHCVLFFRRDRFELQESGTFWLSATPDRSSRGWDACLPRICTWVRLTCRATAQTFHVSNVHLDHLGAQSRGQSLALARERMGAGPALLLGDFNCGLPDLPVPGFADAHAESGSRGTYHAFQGARDLMCIDYILASGHWTVRGAGRMLERQPGQHLSDHYPLWADLELQ